MRVAKTTVATERAAWYRMIHFSSTFLSLEIPSGPAAYSEKPLLVRPAEELVQDNNDGTAAQPVVAAVQLEGFEEEIADGTG
jgi:hypothetical protein